LLAAALAEHPAEGVQRVEVINAGVSNYASDDEYLYLLADLLPFQPDLVIAYDGWNDAEMLSTWFSGDRGTRPYRAGPKQDNGARVNARFTPGGAIAFAAAITSQRALALLDGFFTFRVLHGLFKKTIPFDDVKVPYQPAFSQRAAQFHIENRERMLFLAKQNGFRLASILQPVIGVDGKEYAPIERAYLVRPNMRHEREVFYATVRPLLQSFKAANEEEGVCVADISDRLFIRSQLIDAMLKGIQRQAHESGGYQLNL
jgi:hypothetical protein